MRVERIFEESGIQSELNAYNPLIPDGSNWKATMLIEYPDVDERQRMLAKLVGIEERVWVRVESCASVYAIADEDLPRATVEKTAAVHFLRFELDAEMVSRLNEMGINLSMETVKDIAGKSPVGRPHVADALLREEFVQTYDEAFARYIGYHAPAYVPKQTFTPEQGIDLIHLTRGVAVLAHPGTLKHDEFIPGPTRVVSCARPTAANTGTWC